ncbi:hypothetical protein OG21DRAFT_1491251 [Imleria badia]|nr:hypothetical protein OG21DRAFT_1491251 [Imleria badia]
MKDTKAGAGGVILTITLQPNIDMLQNTNIDVWESQEPEIIQSNVGKTNQEAAAVLRNLWDFNNTNATEAWDRDCVEGARAQQEARNRLTQEEDRQRLLLEQEEEQAKQEERKKYKNKFAPIPARPLPPMALLLPSQHALNRLCKGDYVLLHFFTNKGIRKAEDNISGDENLLTLAKKQKVKDEHLSWEEFSQANYRMVAAMKQQDWPDDRLNMVCDFWITFEMHTWRHDTSKYRKRVLLLYQGRIHRDWHKTLGTSAAFSLLPLNEDRLNKLHQELLDNAYAAKIDAVPTVSITSRTLSNQPNILSFLPTPPYLFPLPPLLFHFHTHPSSARRFCSTHADFVWDAGTACHHLALFLSWHIIIPCILHMTP